ncbi:uncharacterized protein LOC113360019 [Papaver somniferum]|uniref:uncharacterized protein LOC113360019 n=1 Tax=Papaver somniferum TaxID=3469 RepID=UPI000E700EC0|nr:uncharacterized protein LOC113360019 [Papaver somniferum]
MDLIDEMLTNEAVQKGQIYGFQVADEGTVISHFIDANMEEVQRLFIILSMFEVLTGMKLNLEKSTMVSVGADGVIDLMDKELGCKTESLPIKYLGIPIGTFFRNNSVVERVKLKLASWNKKFLNKAGRLVLTKHCLSSLPIYFLSLFNMPVSVEKQLIKLMRKFLWGVVDDNRKMAWVSWLRSLSLR